MVVRVVVEVRSGRGGHTCGSGSDSDSVDGSGMEGGGGEGGGGGHLLPSLAQAPADPFIGNERDKSTSLCCSSCPEVWKDIQTRYKCKTTNTVRNRGIGIPLIGTILIRASVPPRKIGTLLLGFCRPCQCVLPLY